MTVQSRIALASNRLSLSGQSPEQTAGRERRQSLGKVGAVKDYRTPPSIDRVSARERTYAATAHPLEGRYTSRYTSTLNKPLPSIRAGDTRDTVESPSLATKRYSVQSYQPRGYRPPPHLRNSTDGNYLSSPTTQIRRGSIEPDASPPVPTPNGEGGTESSVSTTAPSTVWDELDELKSRIRKLELTGRIPSSSGAAMSTAVERPRTATTAATTVSTSPKRNQAKSTPPTTPMPSDLLPHPILNMALEKVKPCVTETTWLALEATAGDAQILAKMAAGGFAGSGPIPIDRQLKRKADSLCRNLTELCYTLQVAHRPSESERTPSRAQSRARSASRDASAVRQPLDQDDSAISRFQRARSLDPEPTTTQRVLSRLEARRTSLFNSGAASASVSPSIEHHPEAKTPTQATLNRTSTVLQRLRGRADDYGEVDSIVRPLSRATLELGRANTTGHTAASKRVSREYTSRHPLPSPESRSVTAQQALLPQRRSYLSNGNVDAQQEAKRAPTTPGTALGQRRYLSQASEGGSLLESRRRLVSSGQYGAARSLLGTRTERREKEGQGQGQGTE